MALPKFASPQQAGVNPIDVQQENNQNQKIAEVLSKIEARLSNVTNMRSNVQMATFEAFGNNFLTRGLTQVTDSIADSIESLFAQPEKEVKDPVVEQLKKHTDLLEAIVSKSSASSLEFDESITQLRLDIKHNRELDHADFEKQLGKLSEIKDSLDASKKPAYANNRQDSTQEKPSQRLKRIDLSSYDSDMTKREKISDTAIEILDVDKDPSTKVVSEVRKSNGILDGILDTIVGIDKNIRSMFKPDKISTQEDTLEAMQDKNKVTDIEPGQKAPKGERDSFFSKLFNKDLNILGFMNVIKSLTGIFGKVLGVASPLLRIFPALVGAIGALVSLIKKIPIGKLLKSLGGLFGGGNDDTPDIDVDLPDKKKKTPDVDVPDKGKPSPKTPPVKKGGGILNKIGKLAKGLGAAALVAGTAMTFDYVAGKFGVGGKEINEAQDEKNWERASAWEKVQSTPARAVEKAAEFVGLDNFANQAKYDRISNETKYLDDKMNRLEEAQREAEKAKSMGRSDTAAPAVNFNSSTTNNNNQTIIPMRASVKNQDDSFNRYLTSILT